ncbi:alpha,alpha-trehalose phosphorylase [Melghiribacillus thermohalophilus]|uniref:Alpha,alpha-trehalose phosphorylase n=1 Tax=Melghiribacillus thermohalophilus TaxID=1324956 RepID=A0A4R3NGK5_9BACI|nr:glycosyl hydrolase family 65 protein [Melghiribacillus thermohalophilus]TCT26327.1 alpha,alpha-trehalose phosphorylase [Melghiribacillus thermohalophilus]
MTWTVSSRTLQKKDLWTQESLYALGNGYIGVRGNFEETYGSGLKEIRGTYLNAFHDVIDIPYGEKQYGFPSTQQKMVNVIDAQTIKLYFGEEREAFSISDGEILDYKRSLHLDQGYSSRKIHWRSPRGKEVNMYFERLVSFAHRELFTIFLRVEPVNFQGLVTIESTVNGDVYNYVNPDDPRVGAGHAKSLNVVKAEVNQQRGMVLCETKTSDLQVGCLTEHEIHPSSSRMEISSDEHSVSFTYECFLKQGEGMELVKKNIYVDTLRHGNDLLQAANEKMDTFKHLSFSDIKDAQIRYMEAFWKRSDVEIEGDSSLQEGIRFNLFHLLQAAGRDPYSNVGAKGLSGEGYEGHYFWDTEIYIVPVFLMTNPELAKQLLIYRYSILDDARNRARELGHKKGALYPWRTISGTECSSFFPAGTAQYHISADIAYSYIQYFHATKDIPFMIDYGAEVLFETARLWTDVGHYRNDGRFAIEDVTGPDEYTCIVNNNYYTNVMAKHNLYWASMIYHELKKWNQKAFDRLAGKLQLDDQEAEDWKNAADHMYLPYDEERDINPQDDTFLDKAIWDFAGTPEDHYPLLLHYHPLTLYRYQVCKQADTVLAHFLLEDEVKPETMKHSFDYYEKITTHDSSLSTCIFSIMAARLGDMDKAYRYFIETARLDLDNTKGNTKDGLHMANMGGTWMAIVFGFAGLRIKEDGLYLSPKIPEGWSRYSFHVQYQNSNMKITVTNDELKIELIEGSEVTLKLYGERYTIKRQTPFARSIKETV